MLAICILLSILAVVLTATFYLDYKEKHNDYNRKEQHDRSSSTS